MRRFMDAAGTLRPTSRELLAELAESDLRIRDEELRRHGRDDIASGEVAGPTTPEELGWQPTRCLECGTELDAVEQWAGDTRCALHR